MKAVIRNSLFAAALASVLVAVPVLAEKKPPTEGKGITMPEPVLVEVAPGVQLRTRVFVIAPGGVVPLHAHKDNPTVAYYYGGTLSEFNFDGKALGTRGGGKAYADGPAVNHWYENNSKETVTVVVSDIVKQ